MVHKRDPTLEVLTDPLHCGNQASHHWPKSVMIIFPSVWGFRGSCELSKKWESCHVPLQLTSVMTRYQEDFVLRPKQRKHLILWLRYSAPKAYGSPTWSTLWVFQTPPGGRWTRNVSLSCCPAMPMKKQYWYWSLYIARKGGGGNFTIKSTWHPPPPKKKNLLSILMILPNWQLISYSPPFILCQRWLIPLHSL